MPDPDVVPVVPLLPVPVFVFVFVPVDVPVPPPEVVPGDPVPDVPDPVPAPEDVPVPVLPPVPEDVPVPEEVPVGIWAARNAATTFDCSSGDADVAVTASVAADAASP